METTRKVNIFERAPQAGRFGRRQNCMLYLVRAKAEKADETQRAQHEQSAFRSHDPFLFQVVKSHSLPFEKKIRCTLF
jgi:hypothetical protein